MICCFSPGLVAAQELSNLEKWKEQNRAKPVYVVPTLLGKQANQLFKVGGRATMGPASNQYASFCNRDWLVAVLLKTECIFNAGTN